MAAFDSKSYPYWLGTYSTTGGATGIPIGSIMMWATATPPQYWLLCNGQALAQNDYASLFSLIGYSYSLGGAPVALLFSIYNITTLGANGGNITFSSGANGTIALGDTFTISGATAIAGNSINGLKFVATTVTPTNIYFTPTGVGALGNGTGGAAQRTNFNAPRTDARTIRGANATYTLASSGGADTASLAPTNVPSHQHSINGDTGVVNSGLLGNGTNNNIIALGSVTTRTGSAIYDGNNNLVVGTNQNGNAFSITNQYLSLNFIMKYE
jgi:microcystin-dependent protein